MFEPRIDNDALLLDTSVKLCTAGCWESFCLLCSESHQLVACLQLKVANTLLLAGAQAVWPGGAGGTGATSAGSGSDPV